MRFFTEHPHKQGFTYVTHWQFAAAIALRLFRSAFAFIVHATFPWVSIERQFDLEAMARFLLDENDLVEGQQPLTSGPPDGNVDGLWHTAS